MPEYIICLEDGKKLKMLKRHLKTPYDMTPEEYRQAGSDYPMVAPTTPSSAELAKKIGLGTKPRARSAAERLIAGRAGSRSLRSRLHRCGGVTHFFGSIAAC